MFPRGLEAAGPGSLDANIEPDELAVWPNDELTIIQREVPNESEWMLAQNSKGHQGLIPRSHISCYPLVRVPPASLPVAVLPPTALDPTLAWSNQFVDGDDENIDTNLIRTANKQTSLDKCKKIDALAKDRSEECPQSNGVQFSNCSLINQTKLDERQSPDEVMINL